MELKDETTSSRTNGFRSYELTKEKMQEAAKANGDYAGVPCRKVEKEMRQSDTRCKHRVITITAEEE